MKKIFLLIVFLFFSHSAFANVFIGSKNFTEAYVLGEWLAVQIEKTEPVTRRLGMGGTGIVFGALEANKIQFYIEYTGTIARAILHQPKLSNDEIAVALKKRGIAMSAPLGFESNFEIAVSGRYARANNLKTISDLARVASKTRAGFDYEFMERDDGLIGIEKVYGLSGLIKSSMDHALAFKALRDGKIDLTDVNSNDGEIDELHLTILNDDRRVFPHYQAVILTRSDFIEHNSKLWHRIAELAGTLSAGQVRAWNGKIDIQKFNVQEVIGGNNSAQSSLWKDLKRRTYEHLQLVLIALMFSVGVGVPLGIVASLRPWLGHLILLISGTLQTIPSLALLCFLIPIAGIGTGAALMALCLYGLLPIVANTFLGLKSIEPGLLELAKALKLSGWQRLFHIEIPLATKAIVSGIRTSAVITIGTATLAALIGAGGYGATIMKGLAFNDLRLIWEGALPAALMALIAHILLGWLGSALTPRGIRR